MALFNSINGVIKRIIVKELRIGVKYYSNSSDQGDGNGDNNDVPKIDPAIDRTKIIPAETSIKYMNSKAYNETYGNSAVWVKYRRNFKGGFAPKKTRKSCVRNGMISTGNPCPICRDEYLVLNPNNTQLLEQFISEHTGQVLSAFKTGLCQKKQKELMVAIEQAWDQGKLTFDVPFREYDYSLYKKRIEEARKP